MQHQPESCTADGPDNDPNTSQAGPSGPPAERVLRAHVNRCVTLRWLKVKYATLSHTNRNVSLLLAQVSGTLSFLQ